MRVTINKEGILVIIADTYEEHILLAEWSESKLLINIEHDYET